MVNFYEDGFDKENYEEYQRPIKVVLSCTKEYKNEDQVEFLNIHEDIQGRDILTFLCPNCHETHTSYRLG